MTRLEQGVRLFLTHPGVRLSWVAQQLYGENTNQSRAKLSNKIRQREGRHFTQDELDRLDQIRRQFIDRLI